MSKSNAQADWITHVVPELEAPIRLDKYLGQTESLGLTRTIAARLIQNNLLRLNGKETRPKELLYGREVITLLKVSAENPDILAENIPLDVVFEDDYLAVINKPAGMVTHPASGNMSGTLVNALLYHFAELKKSAHSERPGIVHRLDKDTSGLILIARSDTVAGQLQKAISSREIKREYMALVCGHMSGESGTIDLPVGRSIKDRTVMVVTNVNARSAVTHWKLAERFRSYDLLTVTLETGRTHQIRTHLAHLNHPVFGDADYGGRERWHRGIFAPERPLAKRLLGMINRQALHAHRLLFIHPVTAAQIDLSSPLPKDFQSVLDVLRIEGV